MYAPRRQVSSPGSSRSFTAAERVAVSSRRGFNLIELLAVISIVVLLTAMLMPGLRAARGAAEKIVCASNLRNLGVAFHAYSSDFSERLPNSVHLTVNSSNMQEMMALSAGPDEFGRVRWDGLGLLINPWNSYVGSPTVCFCPSHHGDHPFDRYEGNLQKMAFTTEIYGNYQYRGAFDRREMRFFGLDGRRRILVVDGLRTRRDFNHGFGTNRLHSDASVDWLSDTDRSIYMNLPIDVSNDPIAADSLYLWLWDQVADDIE